MVIVLISKQTSDLNELMKMNSSYKVAYSALQNHIVLVGNISSNTLNKFLMEFYHQDHYTTEEIKIVMIQDEPPKKDILKIIN